MNDQTDESYWPEDVVDKTLRPPVEILNKVASELSVRTGGILRGVVKFEARGSDRTAYSFRIVAPALDNFIYALFTVTNDIRLYPATVDWDVGGRTTRGKAGSPSDLKEIIRTLLAEPEVKKIVSGLVVQSKAAR